MKYDLMNKLNTIFDNHIKFLNEKLNENIIDKEKVNEIKKYLDEIKINKNYKKYFEYIKNIYTLLNLEIDESELINIEIGYKICNINFDLTDEQIQYVESGISFIEDKLVELNNRDKYEEDKSKIEDRRNIVNTGRIDSSMELEKLRDYFMSDNISLALLVDGIEDDIQRKILSINNDVEQMNFEEVVEISDSISQTELFSLFQRYGYNNVSYIRDVDLVWITRYGRYDNMESILKIFSSFMKEHYNVDEVLPLDFINKSEQISKILTSSNATNVSQLLELLYNKSDHFLDFKDKFNSLLSYPCAFVRSTKIFQNKTDKSIKDNGDNGGKISKKTNITIAPSLHILETNLQLIDELFSNLSVVEKNKAITDVWDNCLSILLRNTGTISKSMDMCRNYEIPEIVMSKSMGGILRPCGNFYSIVDCLIELGERYENYLFNYPSIVSRGQNFLKKLILLAKSNINVFSNNEVDSTLKGLNKIPLEKDESEIINKFNVSFINSDEISKIDEIINCFKINREYGYTIALDDSFVKFLEENYYVSKNAYNINGVRISRHRVLMYVDALKRNAYTLNKNLYKYILYKDMLINEHEFKKVEEELDKFFSKNSKHVLKLDN